SSATSLRWRANIELAYASASVARYHLHQFLEDIKRFKQPGYVPPGVGAAGRDVVGFQILAVAGPIRSTAPASGSERGGAVVISDADGLEPALPVDQPGNKGLKEMLSVADHTTARTLADMRGQAERALEVVAHNHPRTPWATMAETLKSHLGYYDPHAIYRGPWTQGQSTN
ncbi:MAG: hypothetical protein OER86_13810, partial [Phycisphaerae bacterium]|nr:hypothetical protein [Phycisphaerae bacterium]